MVEYVGLDVSKEETTYCVKDKDGQVFARGKVATDPDALFEALKAHCLCPVRIVMVLKARDRLIGVRRDLENAG